MASEKDYLCPANAQDVEGGFYSDLACLYTVQTIGWISTALGSIRETRTVLHVHMNEETMVHLTVLSNTDIVLF